MTTKQQIESKGFTFYGDESLLKLSPKKQKGKIEFFTLGKYVTDDELEKEYEQRGLVPLDVATLLGSENLDEKKYVGTHWKDESGKWCFATFLRWDGGERDVSVYRDGRDWDDRWWFAGRASSSKSLDSKPSDLSSLELRLSALERTVEKLTKIINI